MEKNNLSKYSIDQLDLMYKTMESSAMREEVAKEIDRRCETKKTSKKDTSENQSLSKAIELIEESTDLIKGKAVPVGTVRNGRQKVAEGKWRPVKKEPKYKEHEIEAQKELFIRAKNAWNDAHGNDKKQMDIAKKLQSIHEKLIDMGVQKRGGTPFWKNALKTGSLVAKQSKMHQAKLKKRMK